jgi:hypothetical protein
MRRGKIELTITQRRKMVDVVARKWTEKASPEDWKDAYLEKMLKLIDENMGNDELAEQFHKAENS